MKKILLMMLALLVTLSMAACMQKIDTHKPVSRPESSSEISSEPSSEPVPNEEKYTYRWDYATQAASDREIAKKKKKRGILVYAITMASVFAL